VGYILTILSTVAFIAAMLMTSVAFQPGGSDVQLILGGVYGVVFAVLFVGACIVFRMDAHNSKKDPPQ
jgi:hypothetical protein